MRRRETFLGLLLLLSIARGADAGRPALSLADAKAREAAIAQIESRRSDDHRQNYSIEVPDAPSNLPESYGISLWTSQCLWLWDDDLARIEVEHRGGRARGEEITSRSVSRGALEADELDGILRIFIYLYSSKQDLLPGKTRFLGGGGYGDEIPYTIEIISRDPALPLRGQMATRHLRGGRYGIDSWGDGIQRFAEHWLVDRLFRMARDHFVEQPVTAERRAEILQRLKGIPGDGVDGQAHLYAQFLAHWAEPAALPEFERLGLSGYAPRLHITLAGDPTELLKPIIADGESDHWFWAMDWMRRRADPSVRRAVLLHGMANAGDGWTVQKILVDLNSMIQCGWIARPWRRSASSTRSRTASRRSRSPPRPSS